MVGTPNMESWMDLDHVTRVARADVRSSAKLISPPQNVEQVRIAAYEHVASSGLMDKLC